MSRLHFRMYASNLSLEKIGPIFKYSSYELKGTPRFVIPLARKYKDMRYKVRLTSFAYEDEAKSYISLSCY